MPEYVGTGHFMVAFRRPSARQLSHSRSQTSDLHEPRSSASGEKQRPWTQTLKLKHRMCRISRQPSAGESFCLFRAPLHFEIPHSLLVLFMKLGGGKLATPKPLNFCPHKWVRDALVPVPHVSTNLQSALHWGFQTCTPSKLKPNTPPDALHP